MTAVRPPAAPSAPSPEPAAALGPVPRRVHAPRWLDLRLVLGVLLVLGSVLLGARVVGAADATVPVWAVATDLAAGSELTTADLVAVDVRLDGTADAYVSARTDPTGRTLGRAVRDGELLPLSALEEPGDLVHLALPVQSGFVPPDLRRGQLVDVYAVADPRAGAAAADSDDAGVALVVERAAVQAISGRSEGVLAAATTTVQVVVALPAGNAPDVLATAGGRPLVVVVHETVDDEAAGVAGVPGQEDSGDTTQPADPGD